MCTSQKAIQLNVDKNASSSFGTILMEEGLKVSNIAQPKVKILMEEGLKVSDIAQPKVKILMVGY